MLRMLAVVAGAVLAMVLIFGFALPESTRVERSIVISAPPEAVFPLINDHRNFNAWSPWAARDPDAVYTYSGAEKGVGATLSWASEQEDVGRGSQTIIESVDNRLVQTRLSFDGQGEAEATFSLVPVAEGTQVTWGFETSHGLNIVSRFFGAFFFDGWIGADYEAGLANLKRVAEAKAGETAPALPPGGATAPDRPRPLVPGGTPMAPELVSLSPRPILFVSTRAKAQDPQEIARALADAYRMISQALGQLQLPMDGAPLALTRSFDPEGDWVFDAAIPVLAPPPPGSVLPDGVQVGETPAVRAVRIVHQGPYVDMAAAYAAGAAHIRDLALTEAGGAIEEYVSDPATTPEANLITNVYMFVRQ